MRDILIEKNFHQLYEKVFEERLKSDWTDGDKFPAYEANFQRLDFHGIQKEFKLIEDNNTVSLFIPVNIPLKSFENKELLKELAVLSNDG